MRTLVFVSDFFVEHYHGGAELTMQAIIDARPSNTSIIKIQSHLVTPELVIKHKNDEWVLVNYIRTPKASLVELVQQDVTYNIVECDYKYCIVRSSHVHEMQAKAPCRCETSDYGKFIRGLMKRAKNVFFMSEAQRDEYIRVFPSMSTWPNLHVQGSTWSPEHLDELEKLRLETPVKNGKVAVLSDQGGMLWVKNQKWHEEYLKDQGKPYDVVGGGLPYKEFLKQLSQYSSLCFHPLGFDTDPRLVTEAKLMGLELDLGDLVQTKAKVGTVTSEQLRLRPTNFWNQLN